MTTGYIVYKFQVCKISEKAKLNVVKAMIAELEGELIVVSML